MQRLGSIPHITSVAATGCFYKCEVITVPRLDLKFVVAPASWIAIEPWNDTQLIKFVGSSFFHDLDSNPNESSGYEEPCRGHHYVPKLAQ